MLVTENVTSLREKRHGFGRSFIRYEVSVKIKPGLEVNPRDQVKDREYRGEPVGGRNDD
jgi:hypothetical protein